MKAKIALVTYWILFIILPTFIFSFTFRGSPLMVLVTIAALIAFILLGERGFKEWKKLWKIN